MIKKIHPDHLRYLLLVVNTLLTFFMISCGIWAFGWNEALSFAGLISDSGGRQIKDYRPVRDLSPFMVTKSKTSKRGGVRSVPQISNLLEVKPKAPELPQPEPAETPEEEIVDDKGPLSEKWEIVNAFVTDDPSLRWVVIGEKKPQSSRRTFTSSRSYSSSRYRRSSTSSRLASRYGKRKTKMLQIRDEVNNPDPVEIDDEKYYVLDITGHPLAMIYCVAGQAKKKYRLVREEKNPDLMAEGEDGEITSIVLKPEPKEEDTKKGLSRNKKGAKSPSDPGYIKVGNRRFGGPDKNSGAGSSGTIKRSGSSKPTKAQLNDLRKVMNKIPPAERNQIKKAMRGGIKR